MEKKIEIEVWRVHACVCVCVFQGFSLVGRRMGGRVRDTDFCDAVTNSRSLCVGEACWWTIHPASKQRSEGEKVRIGDDLILVSVSSERYLVSIS